jgi:hypothetical protein
MFEQPRKGLFKGPFYAIPGHEEYKKRFLGKTIMNNKAYLILLSSFIACTSMGMKRAAEDDAIEVKRVRYTNSNLSLLEMSSDVVQRELHQAVKKDLVFLKDSQQLTATNVEKNINNEMALLELPESLENHVSKAYRVSDRWLNIPKYEQVKHGEYGREEEENEWIVYYKPNSDASEIAEIVWKGDRDQRYLYVWRENADGWYKTLQSKVDATAEDMVWDSADDVLLVASKDAITILNRTPENPLFAVSQKVEITPFRFEKSKFGLAGYGKSVSETIDDIAKVFGRFAWNAEKKHLAVETKRDMVTMKSHVTIVQLDDNDAVRNTQEIQIPIVDEYGINSIEFNENGVLGVVRVTQEKIKVASWAIGSWGLNTGKYEPNGDTAIDSIEILTALDGKYPHQVTQASAHNLLSNGRFSGIVGNMLEYVRFPGIEREHVVTAIRRNQNVGLRHVGFATKGANSQSPFGFLIHNEVISLPTIARHMCKCYADPLRYRVEQRNEDSIL